MGLRGEQMQCQRETSTKAQACQPGAVSDRNPIKKGKIWSVDFRKEASRGI